YRLRTKPAHRAQEPGYEFLWHNRAILHMPARHMHLLIPLLLLATTGVDEVPQFRIGMTLEQVRPMVKDEFHIYFGCGGGTKLHLPFKGIELRFDEEDRLQNILRCSYDDDQSVVADSNRDPVEEACHRQEDTERPLRRLARRIPTR